MEHLHDLMELGKDLKVLYVEDDESLRIETKKIIERIFGRVDVASNGIEGYVAFNANDYDLVITDIEMPCLNGIEMSRKIRMLSQDTPIVIISAYTRTDYFIEAISLSVDHYLLKPIKMPQLVKTLYDAAKAVAQKRSVGVERHNEIVQRVWQANEKMLSEISNAASHPSLVYRDEKISFINAAFQELFTEEEDLQTLVDNEQHLWEFLNKKISIDTHVHAKNDFVEAFESFEECLGKKISLRTKNGRKIFSVSKNTLNLEGCQKSLLYTFEDITVLEYQKVQINHYNAYMNELMYTTYKRKEAENKSDIINKTTF
jgi:YesN/AraC family two-component response regulator